MCEKLISMFLVCIIIEFLRGAKNKTFWVTSKYAILNDDVSILLYIVVNDWNQKFRGEEPVVFV